MHENEMQWPKAQETADLITFTEEIPNGKTSFFVQCEMKMK